MDGLDYQSYGLRLEGFLPLQKKVRIEFVSTRLVLTCNLDSHSMLIRAGFLRQVGR